METRVTAEPANNSIARERTTRTRSLVTNRNDRNGRIFGVNRLFKGSPPRRSNRTTTTNRFGNRRILPSRRIDGGDVSRDTVGPLKVYDASNNNNKRLLSGRRITRYTYEARSSRRYWKLFRNRTILLDISVRRLFFDIVRSLRIYIYT